MRLRQELSKSKVVLGLSLSFLLLVATGCDFLGFSGIPIHDSDHQECNDENQFCQEVDLTIIAGLTVDEEGNNIIPVQADPSTLLYYRRTGLPVLAPDGHQLTAGEFSAPKGTTKAKCLEPGTKVTLHLSGLVPHGIYRNWILTFKEPGFDLMAPNPFEHLIGNGALGPNDRSRNTFKASASGKGTISRFIPKGNFSEFGMAEACQISDAFEWHVVVALQQPGEPHGTEVGPPVLFPTSAVEQIVFVFK